LGEIAAVAAAASWDERRVAGSARGFARLRRPGPRLDARRALLPRTGSGCRRCRSALPADQPGGPGDHRHFDYLSPNSLLLNGQQDTLDRFADLMHEWLPQRLHLRKNEHRWPPLHSPLMWQRNIPNRAAVLMQTTPFELRPPVPPVLSLVTGAFSYNDVNARQLLADWVDHPQRLWDAVYETLAQGSSCGACRAGAEFGAGDFQPAGRECRELLAERSLSESVGGPFRGRCGALVGEAAAACSAVLRAPLVQQVMLEDWLLEQELE